MADITERRKEALRLFEVGARDRELRRAVRMVAHVTPRVGHDDEALEYLVREARGALGDY
jgi:hypothetical protein